MNDVDKKTTLEVIKEVEALLLELEKELQEKRASRIAAMKKLKAGGISCAEIGRNVGSQNTPPGLSRERVSRLVNRKT